MGKPSTGSRRAAPPPRKLLASYLRVVQIELPAPFVHIDNDPETLSIIRWVLDHGRPFPGRRYRRHVYRDHDAREPNRCFDNTVALIARHPELVFVEGYVFHHRFPDPPIHHAWATTRDGRVVDPTPYWASGNARYFGVPLDLDYIRRHSLGFARLARRGHRNMHGALRYVNESRGILEKAILDLDVAVRGRRRS